jgi:hypothetical protein
MEKSKNNNAKSSTTLSLDIKIQKIVKSFLIYKTIDKGLTRHGEEKN